MLRHFDLLESAERERDQAIERYEGERPGLGSEFFERYEATVQYALRFPDRAISSADGDSFATCGATFSIGFPTI